MAGIKIRKLTAAQFRKELRGYSREDLAALLEGLYKDCPDAASYLNIRMGGEAYEKALLSEAKEKVRKGFYTNSGKARLNLDAARTAINDFEKIGPSAESLIDLRLNFIEYGAEIISDYRRLPDSLFSSVERMIQAMIRTFNQIKEPAEGRRLAAHFRDRLDKLANMTSWDNEWFFDNLDSELQEIKWLQTETETVAADIQTGDALLAEAASKGSQEGILQSVTAAEDAHTEAQVPAPAVELPPITDASAILPEEDGKLFYKLWLPLLDYVNMKLHINDLRDLRSPEDLDPAAVKEISCALTQNLSLIDDYLKEKGGGLAPEHRSIVAGWKKLVEGRFVLERNLKKGSILISIDNNAVYQVRGIQSSLEEMLSYYPAPLLIDTTILPYRGILIIDGIVSPLNVMMGGGIKKTFKDAYTSAKRRKQIITTL